MSGFRKFLMRGNLIDLAVAVVIGLAFANVVTALVKDIITPLIGAAGGSHLDFSKLAFTLNGQPFLYGDFINYVVTFVIVAAVIYFLVVAPAGRMESYANRNKAATTRDCPECLSTIPVGARRCMYCTAVVVPDQPSAADVSDVPQQRHGRHGQFAADAE
jgi:large conductance mechanosensitive channel